MRQKQTEFSQSKIEAEEVVPVFPTHLGNTAAALLFAGLLMIFSLRGSAIAQSQQSAPTNDGSFKILPLTAQLSGGSLASSLPGGTFKWSANGLLPAQDWLFSDVVIGGTGVGSRITMSVLGYKDFGPNAFPRVNSGNVKQIRSVSLTVNGSLNASEFRGVFCGTVTGTLVGGGSGSAQWTASADNATLMGCYKSSPSSNAVPAAILVSFNSTPVPSSASIPAIGGSLSVLGGSYMMGDALGDIRRDEVPVHHVRLDAFTISRTEVSKEDWDFVRDQANLLNKGYQIAPGVISGPPTATLSGGTATLAGGTVTSSSATAYVQSTLSLIPGMLLSGSGIATGAKIESILSGTSFLMSSVASGSFRNSVIQVSSNSKKYPVVGIAWEETLKWCNAKSEVEGLTPCYYLTESPLSESVSVVGATSAGSLAVKVSTGSGIAAGSSVSGGGIPAGAKVTRLDYALFSRSGNLTVGSNQVTGLTSTVGLTPGMYVSGRGIGLSSNGRFSPVMISSVSQGSIILSGTASSSVTGTDLQFHSQKQQPIWETIVYLNLAATTTAAAVPLQFNPPARSSVNVYRSGKVYNMNNAKVDWSANGYRLPTEAEWEYVAKVDLASLAFKGGTVSNGTLGYRTIANAAQPSAFNAAQSGAAYSPLWLGAGPLYNGTLSSSVVAEGMISDGTMFLTQAPRYRRFPVASSVESSVLASLGSYLHKDLANYQPNTPSIPAGTRLGSSFPNIGFKVWDLTPFFPMINPITRKRQFHPVWGGYSAPTSELPIETNGTQGMAGNVWEWCWDYYGAYRPEPATNPRGPGTGSRRVIRGGGAKYDAAYCRATDRGFNGPIFSSSCFEIGFRWVRK